MEYLGFWVTRTGILQINRKGEAIVNMTPTKNKKQVRMFIGMINYYMDMWSRRSHLLHPLTSLTSIYFLVYLEYNGAGAWFRGYENCYPKTRTVGGLFNGPFVTLPNFNFLNKTIKISYLNLG